MKRLVATSHAESPYERPDDPYRCGLSADRACPLGPDRRGRCAGTECVPRKEPGSGQLVCGRAPVHGGRCPEGPTSQGRCSHAVGPCAPTLQLRAARGLTARAAVIVVLGLLLAALATPSWRRRLLDPGPLSTHHVVLTERCEACHTTALSPTRWLVAAIDSARPLRDADRCQGCHVFAEFGGAVHGLSPSELASISSGASAAAAAGGLLDLAGRVPPPEEVPTCARCHPEHRGHEAALPPRSAEVCGPCHKARFPSLAKGHPEFRTFGAGRPVGIRFDHAKHALEHFPGKNQVFDATACARCHRPDVAGRHMRVRDFEEACGECHRKDVEGAGAAPLTLFAFPRLPVPDLGAVGAWPLAGGGQALLDPALELLLRGDPALSGVSLVPPGQTAKLPHRCSKDPSHPVVEDLTAAWEPTDCVCSECEAPLVPVDPAVGTQVAALSQAVKRLFLELAGAGRGDAGARAQLQARWQRVSGAHGDDEALTRLLRIFPRDVLAEAARKWGLPAEPDLGQPAKVVEEWEGGALDPTGAWQLGKDAALRHAPAGHRDPVTRAWLDLIGGLAPDSLGLALLRARAPPGAPTLELVASCNKCHELEVSPDRMPVIHWEALHAQRRVRSLTQFSHRPHDQIPTVAGSCTNCHSPRWEASAEDRARADARGDGSFILQHGFDTRAGCATCHAPGKVTDDCQVCHTYHVAPSTLTKLAVIGD